MTVSDDFHATKTARDQVLYLEVETSICPQALPRVLDLLAVQGLHPLSISAARNPEGQHMVLGLEAIQDGLAERLLHKMQAIVSVADARYVRRE